MTKPAVTHVSRFDMKRMLKNNEVPDNTLIISINDTESEWDEISNFVSNYDKRVACALYRFKDDPDSFTAEQAEDIVNFVDNGLGYGDIIVHCFAGISRSAAVAKWINDYLELDIPKYNEYRQHNRHVYDLLCKVSGVENINNYYRGLE